MPEYRITTGLPQLPVQSDEKSFGLVLPLYQAMNALAKALAQEAGAVDFNQVELAQRNQLASINTQNHKKLYALAPVAIPFGHLVNVYLDSGKLAVRDASALSASAKAAHGMVTQLDGIDAGQFGEVTLFEGYTTGVGGTTVGATYYLSTTPGLATATAPASPNLRQAVGMGLGSAGFYLSIDLYTL